MMTLYSIEYLLLPIWPYQFLWGEGVQSQRRSDCIIIVTNFFVYLANKRQLIHNCNSHFLQNGKTGVELIQNYSNKAGKHQHRQYTISESKQKQSYWKAAKWWGWFY